MAASGKPNEDVLVKASSVQRQKDKLLLVSAQELLESGELASKALNEVSPRVIALWQRQQSQLLGAVQT